jgi:phenylacetate-CoA ligase
MNDLVFPLTSRIRRHQDEARYRELLRVERLPLKEQQRIQLENLNHVLERSAAHVPYYRDKLASASTRLRSVEQLAELPVLTKRDIEGNFPDRITDQQSERSDWQYHATSGTTDRLICITDAELRYQHWARVLRSQVIAGQCCVGRKRMLIPPDVCSLACGDRQSESEVLWDSLKKALSSGREHLLGNLADFVRDNRWRIPYRLFYREKELPSFGPEGTAMSDDDLMFYIDEIRRYRPHMLFGLPTYLHVLAHFIRDKGLEPPAVPVIKPMGASTSATLKAFIGETFRSQVYEDYGSHEFSGVASECEAHAGYHVAMSDFVVEVVRDGRPAREGQLGHILITDTRNTVMPFIRYQIGDVGRLYREPCPCGRESHRVAVDGRLHETIVTPAGEAFTGDFFQDFFHQVGGVKHFQINQKRRNKLEVLLVGRNNGERIDEEAVARRLKEHVGEMRLKLFTVKGITPEASGKFRYVKSTSFSDFSL